MFPWGIMFVAFLLLRNKLWWNISMWKVNWYKFNILQRTICKLTLLQDWYIFVYTCIDFSVRDLILMLNINPLFVTQVVRVHRQHQEVDQEAALPYTHPMKTSTEGLTGRMDRGLPLEELTQTLVDQEQCLLKKHWWKTRNGHPGLYIFYCVEIHNFRFLPIGKKIFLKGIVLHTEAFFLYIFFLGCYNFKKCHIFNWNFHTIFTMGAMKQVWML